MIQDRLRELADELGRRAARAGLHSGWNPYVKSSPALAEVWENARKSEEKLINDDKESK